MWTQIGAVTLTEIIFWLKYGNRSCKWPEIQHCFYRGPQKHTCQVWRGSDEWSWTCLPICLLEGHHEDLVSVLQSVCNRSRRYTLTSSMSVPPSVLQEQEAASKNTLRNALQLRAKRLQGDGNERTNFCFQMQRFNTCEQGRNLFSQIFFCSENESLDLTKSPKLFMSELESYLQPQKEQDVLQQVVWLPQSPKLCIIKPVTQDAEQPTVHT